MYVKGVTPGRSRTVCITISAGYITAKKSKGEKIAIWFNEILQSRSWDRNFIGSIHL